MRWQQYFSLVAIATSFAQHVYGQTTTAMPAVATQGFDSSQVSATTKSQWCVAQTSACTQICYGQAPTNLCNSNTLTYSCSCANGTTPDVTAFVGTLPYYMCQATFAQCINAHPNDQTGQATCTSNEKCGTRNATAEYLAHQASGSTQASGSSSSSSSSSARSSTSASPAIPNNPSFSSSTTSTSSLVSSSSSGVGASTSTSSSTTSSTVSSVAATTSSSTNASASLSPSKSSGLSTGAAAGLAVGVTLGVVFIALFAFWMLRRRRKAAKVKAADGNTGSSSTPSSDFHEKPELLGTLGTKNPASTTSPTGPWNKPEMQTNANRHEMDQTNAYGSVNRKAVASTSIPRHLQPEMFTNSNRHEMDDTGVSATLNGPWSMDGRAELDGYGHRT